jgi:hypothetical protein
MHDLDCAILIYHDKHVSSVSRRSKKSGSLVVEGTANEPKTAYVHFAPSSKMSSETFLALKHWALDLSSGLTVSRTIDDLEVCLEPWLLPANRMLGLGVGTSKVYECDIGGAAYSIRSPAPFARLGRQLPVRDRTHLRCWKVTVTSMRNGRTDSAGLACDWTLAAFGLDPKCKPTEEISLSKI